MHVSPLLQFGTVWGCFWAYNRHAMSGIELPVVSLPVREQAYSCHGCGNCCRDFTVQLRDEDIAKLQQQNWERTLGEAVTVSFRGVTYLRQRENGACVFLMDNGLCRIHAEFGFEAKPIACQLFPFHLTPASAGRGAVMGINYACQSVLENKGTSLRSHVNELRRMSSQLPELNVKAPLPLLTDRLRMSQRELEVLTSRIDRWLRDDDHALSVRLDGLAWVVSSLAIARLEQVREERFAELIDLLFSVLPQELDHHPIEPATKRQRRLLRQAVFARTEDPKINLIEKQGRLRTTIAQLWRSRRFKSGKGVAPRIGEGWPEHVLLDSAEHIDAAKESDGAGGGAAASERAAASLTVHAIDDLITRYLRASILGGRCWGPGYYGWPIIGGLQALVLNVACTGWLARLHAAGRNNTAIDIIDVRAALGRIDRTAGRAKWLGSAAERLRLSYLTMNDGLRRLLSDYALLDS